MLNLFLIVFAQAPEFENVNASPEDIPGMANVLVEAFQSQNWPLFVGMLSMLLAALVGLANGIIYKMTAIGDETRKKILPWLVAAGGMLTAFGSALIGGVDWFPAIVAGFMTSAGAIALWELVLKHIKNLIVKK